MPVEPAAPAHLTLAQAVAAAVADATGVEQAFETAARVLWTNTQFRSVTATLADRRAGEQWIVADFTHRGSSAMGLRRPLDEGLMGATLRAGEPIVLGRAGADPRYRWDGDTVYESMLIAPVVVDGTAEGAIELADPRPDLFTAEDAVLLRTVADQLATALVGIRTRQESERRAARLTLGSEVARATAGAGSIEEALRIAVSTLFSNTAYSAVTAVLADRDRDEQLVVLDLVRIGSAITSMRRPLGVGVTGEALASGRQQTVEDVEASDRYVLWEQPLLHRSALITPVMAGARAVAALCLFQEQPHAFDRSDQALMQTIAEHVAAVLRGVRLREESERRAARLALALEVARTVTGAGSVEQALREAAVTVRSAVGCAAVAAFVPAAEPGMQLALVDVDEHGQSIQGTRRPIGHGVSGRVFTTGEQLLIDRVSDSGHPPWREPDERMYEAVLATPIRSGDETVAVIGLYDVPESAFDEQDAILMQTVCEHLGLTLRLLEARNQSDLRAQHLTELERRQRALLDRLVRVQEYERSRLAEDLHDDTIQVLSAGILALDAVAKVVARDHPAGAARLAGVSEMISGAVERARRMTFELRPAALWHHGLATAVQQMVDAFARETGVTASLEVTGPAGRLDPILEAIVFRSISEALANVRAHARAGRVTVELRRDGTGLEVVVADDGTGFDLEPALARARRTNHLGLETLTERVQAAGGEVAIETRPGAGTRVRIELRSPPADG